MEPLYDLNKKLIGNFLPDGNSKIVLAKMKDLNDNRMTIKETIGTFELILGITKNVDNVYL